MQRGNSSSIIWPGVGFAFCSEEKAAASGSSCSQQSLPSHPQLLSFILLSLATARPRCCLPAASVCLSFSHSHQFAESVRRREDSCHCAVKCDCVSVPALVLCVYALLLPARFLLSPPNLQQSQAARRRRPSDGRHTLHTHTQASVSIPPLTPRTATLPLQHPAV